MSYNVIEIQIENPSIVKREVIINGEKVDVSPEAARILNAIMCLEKTLYVVRDHDCQILTFVEVKGEIR